MNEVNKINEKENARRSFIRKLLGVITAAILFPGFKGIFASTKKWTTLLSSGNKNKPLGDIPFVAEIDIVGFNFAPVGWAFCNGQILPIQLNTALFSLLGIYYGGDGKSNFALPNFQSRFPMGTGQGSGLTTRYIGENGGIDYKILSIDEIPAHQHGVFCNNSTGNSADPTYNYFARDPLGTAHYGTANGNNNYELYNSGGSLPHNNMHPYLTLNFIIALSGAYPARS